jgi:holo-[acyl-carrier protein] synthase
MIGIDIVVILRVRKMTKKFKNKFLDKFLTKKEQKIANNASTVAGFWAVKEAASKAIGTGIGKECGFKDIKITKTKLNQPLIKYSKKIRDKYKIESSSVSITHDGGFAIAVVVNTIKKSKK